MINSSGLLIPSITRAKQTGFPSKRETSTLLSTATIMPSHCEISSAVSASFTPPAPLVSTFMDTPSLLAAFFRAAAAIYVCAIPVGHAVTASTLYFVFDFFSFTKSSGNFSASFELIILRNSLALFACLSLLTNSASKSNCMSLESTLRYSSPSSVAAIINISLHGLPSGEPKSTPSGTVMAASEGTFTAEHLAWGTAISIPTVVRSISSRFKISFLNLSESIKFPQVRCKDTSLSIASALSATFTPIAMPSIWSKSEIRTDSPLLQFI